MNCLTGRADGQSLRTCANCLAITEDRHVDVIEMDAASRTGVDDIREIIEGVRYKPVSARFKVYIRRSAYAVAQRLQRLVENP